MGTRAARSELRADDLFSALFAKWSEVGMQAVCYEVRAVGVRAEVTAVCVEERPVMVRALEMCSDDSDRRRIGAMLARYSCC